MASATVETVLSAAAALRPVAAGVAHTEAVFVAGAVPRARLRRRAKL